MQSIATDDVASICHPAKSGAAFELTATQRKRRNMLVNVVGAFVSKPSRVAAADLLNSGSSRPDFVGPHDDR